MRDVSDSTLCRCGHAKLSHPRDADCRGACFGCDSVGDQCDGFVVAGSLADIFSKDPEAEQLFLKAMCWFREGLWPPPHVGSFHEQMRVFIDYVYEKHGYCFEEYTI